MCAIVSLIECNDSSEDIEQHRRNLFSGLLYCSEIRGRHATGICWVDSNGEVQVVKKAVQASDFFQLPEYVEALARKGSNIFLAHCRYSTSGDYIDNENNHPIKIGNRAVVHNGVITQEPKESWSSLFGVDCQTNTDSEILLRVELQSLLRSSATIAGAILDESGLSIFRNTSRPLWLVNVPDLLCYYVCSTRDIFLRAIELIGFEGEYEFIEIPDSVCLNFSIKGELKL